MAEPDTFRVNPAVTPLPSLSAPSSENAAPGQLTQLGGAIQGAGKVATDIYTDVLREQNEARVTAAMTELNNRAINLRTGKDGYATLMGKNALDRPDGKSLDQEYGERLDKDRADIASTLTNEAQREAFTRNAAGLQTQFHGQVGEHLFKQAKVFKVEGLNGMAESGARQVALAAGNATEIASGRSVVAGAAKQLAAEMGWDENATAEFTRKALSPSHQIAFSQLYDAGEYKKAADYLNTYRDEFDEKAYSLAHSAVNEGLMQKNVIAKVDQWGGVAAATTPTAKELYMPLTGDWKVTPNGKYGAPRPHHRSGSKTHAGNDLQASIGTPVQASGDGVIRYRNTDPEGYGTAAELVLANGDVVLLAHLSSIKVPDGTRVSRGQTIALTGDSGNAKGSPHLHLEVRKGGKTKVDPKEYFTGGNTAPGVGGALPPRAEAMEWANANFTGKELEIARREIDDRYRSRDYDERRTQEAVVNSAWEEANSKGNISAGTVSRLNQAGQASTVTTIRNWARAEQDRKAGKAVDPEKAADTRNLLYGMFADGKIKSENDLLPFRPMLDRNDYDQLVKMSIERRAGNAAAAADPVSIGKTFDDVKAEVPLFKDDKDGTKLAAFRGSVIAAIAAEERARNAPIKNEERRAIVLGMAANTTLKERDGRTVLETNSGYNNIPVAQRREIESSLRRRSGRNPQAWEVLQEYNNTWGRMK
jgi:murein DD-endopeptidase MepM/ murein hydrolase activator NlpD